MYRESRASGVLTATRTVEDGSRAGAEGAEELAKLELLET